jgi:pimeloyl-ACP methyl ester carboxylesterase
VATVRRLVESRAFPLVIVGHSYGAVIALELARRHPELVARLVLIEPLALHLLRQRDQDAGTAALQALTTRVAELVQQRAQLEAARLLSSYWDESAWAKLPDEQRARFAEGMPRIMRTLRELAALRVSLDDYRQAVHVPTVLIRGARSTPPTRWIAAQLARTLPQAMLFDVAGAGHMCPVTHPHELAFLLRRTVLERARDFAPGRD